MLAVASLNLLAETRREYSNKGPFRTSLYSLYLNVLLWLLNEIKTVMFEVRKCRAGSRLSFGCVCDRGGGDSFCLRAAAAAPPSVRPGGSRLPWECIETERSLTHESAYPGSALLPTRCWSLIQEFLSGHMRPHEDKGGHSPYQKEQSQRKISRNSGIMALFTTVLPTILMEN